MARLKRNEQPSVSDAHGGLVLSVFVNPNDLERCNFFLHQLAKHGFSNLIIAVRPQSAHQNIYGLLAESIPMAQLRVIPEFDITEVTQQNVKKIESCIPTNGPSAGLSLIPSEGTGNKETLVVSKSSLLAFRSVQNIVKYHAGPRSGRARTSLDPRPRILSVFFQKAGTEGWREQVNKSVERPRHSSPRRILGFSDRMDPLMAAENKVAGLIRRMRVRKMGRQFSFGRYDSHRILLGKNPIETAFRPLSFLSIPEPERFRIAAVGAHPDDIELGCGATMAMHKKLGDQTFGILCTLGGVRGDPNDRIKEAKRGSEILGYDLSVIDYPVPKLNTASRDFARQLLRVFEQIKPDRIYTHSPKDYHQVHVAVSRCVSWAASQIDVPPQVLHFETISSTAPEFMPNAFADISDFIDKKISSVMVHKTQADRFYLQENVIRSLANTRYVWGKVGNDPFGLAEAFSISSMPIFAINEN